MNNSGNREGHQWTKIGEAIDGRAGKNNNNNNNSSLSSSQLMLKSLEFIMYIIIKSACDNGRMLRAFLFFCFSCVLFLPRRRIDLFHVRNGMASCFCNHSNVIFLYGVDSPSPSSPPRRHWLSDTDTSRHIKTCMLFLSITV